VRTAARDFEGDPTYNEKRTPLFAEREAGARQPQGFIVRQSGQTLPESSRPPSLMSSEGVMAIEAGFDGKMPPSGWLPEGEID